MSIKITIIFLLGLTIAGCGLFRDEGVKPPLESAQSGRASSNDSVRQAGNKNCPPRSARNSDMIGCKLKITQADYRGVPAPAWLNFRFVFSQVNNRLQVSLREEGCPDEQNSNPNCRKIPLKISPVVKSSYITKPSGGAALEYIFKPVGTKNRPSNFHCLKINMYAQPDDECNDFKFDIFHIESNANPQMLKCAPKIEHDGQYRLDGHDNTPGGGGKGVLSHDITSGGGRYSN